MSDKKSDKESPELASNRKASHEYEILDTFEAGIVLQGTEIKSLRNHGGSLQEAYVRVLKNELWLIGCHIAHYRFGNIHNHEERRDRKLLMHRSEINKLESAVREKGLALVPLSMYLRQGKVKLRIGLARGKKMADKRHAIKERDSKREMDRIKKQFG
jgi:SsrA-binding protein